MLVAWGTLGTLVFTRADALVEVVRGGREPYRLLNSGAVANQQRVRFTNQLARDPALRRRGARARQGATLVVERVADRRRPPSRS